MENLKNLEPLSNEQMDKITGGWRLFGWEAIYDDQTMVTDGAGMDQSGSYGSNYIFGISGREHFKFEKWDQGTGINSY